MEVLLRLIFTKPKKKPSGKSGRPAPLVFSRYQKSLVKYCRKNMPTFYRFLSMPVTLPACRPFSGKKKLSLTSLTRSYPALRKFYLKIRMIRIIGLANYSRLYPNSLLAKVYFVRSLKSPKGDSLNLYLNFPGRLVDQVKAVKFRNLPVSLIHPAYEFVLHPELARPVIDDINRWLEGDSLAVLLSRSVSQVEKDGRSFSVEFRKRFNALFAKPKTGKKKRQGKSVSLKKKPGTRLSFFSRLPGIGLSPLVKPFIYILKIFDAIGKLVYVFFYILFLILRRAVFYLDEKLHISEKFHLFSAKISRRKGFRRFTIRLKKLLRRFSGFFHGKHSKKKARKMAAVILQNRLVKAFVYTSAVVFILSGSLFYWFILKDLPSPGMLGKAYSPQSTIIRDRNGKVLYKVYKDANRIWLDWNEIPDIVKNSTLAIEDDNFYRHLGISPKAMIRALVHNFNQDNVNMFQGGSTITQQLVKNTLLTSERTYTRKIKEAVLSLWAERIFTKNEIFTFYLNEVGYGGPAYGIEAASQMYFAKHTKDLTLAEATFLAGLPAAPTTFSPFGANPEQATIRQRQVLERMLKLKMITKAQYDEALGEEMVFAPQKIDIFAPHFVMYVRKQLVDKFGEAMVTQGGLDVTTTLDLSVQDMAQEVVTRQVSQIKSIYRINNAATLVTDPKNGDILAMVGSVNYFDTDNKGYVNATNSLRQPGSSIKPVNYGYAFDHGYTPTSVIDDNAVVYVAPGSTEKYAPKNYDGRFHGRVTLRSALANSYNIPAVKLLNSYGVDKMLSTGRAMGIESWPENPQIGLSLTLGGLEVTMLDMARAYSTIANYGKPRELRTILAIKDKKGDNLTASFYRNDKGSSVMPQAQAEGNTQVISPLSAYWLIDILSDNKARMPAFGSYAKLSVPNHKIAVKTGTSNDFRDNWTIGFSPEYLVATWVGNNDGSFMNKNLVSGITGAAPIWHETMTNLLKDKEPKDFPKPEGMVEVKICATNGLLTCPNCPLEKVEYFSPDRVPTQKCFFRSGGECAEARKQAAEGEKSEAEKKALLQNCP